MCKKVCSKQIEKKCIERKINKKCNQTKFLQNVQEKWDGKNVNPRNIANKNLPKKCQNMAKNIERNPIVNCKRNGER